MRGKARELLKRGHRAQVYEPAAGWSRTNLIKSKGQKFIYEFFDHYPDLESKLYHLPGRGRTNNTTVVPVNALRFLSLNH